MIGLSTLVGLCVETWSPAWRQLRGLKWRSTQAVRAAGAALPVVRQDSELVRQDSERHTSQPTGSHLMEPSLIAVFP